MSNEISIGFNTAISMVKDALYPGERPQSVFI